MILAKIAAYAVSIVAILGLSIKFMWLFFILFTYRTYASIVTFEWMKDIGLDSHMIYFIVILTLSLVTYGLILRFTIDLPWIKYVVLAVMMAWVFMNYEFSQIFLFKDYLESRGMWSIDWFTAQIKALFNTSSGDYTDLFSSAFEDVFNSFGKLFDGVAAKFK